VVNDATACRERWIHNWQPKGHEISPTNRGVAIMDGKLIRGTADGYLIALDMANGNLLWSRQIASASDSQYLSMPPLICGDLILYGPAGADYFTSGTETLLCGRAITNVGKGVPVIIEFTAAVSERHHAIANTARLSAFGKRCAEDSPFRYRIFFRLEIIEAIRRHG